MHHPCSQSRWAITWFYRTSPVPTVNPFPTRRSSDLVRETVAEAGVLHWPGRVLTSTDLRSEEHTSELQSRFDLVCRLLLAKKSKANESSLSRETLMSRWSSPSSFRWCPAGAAWRARS